MSSKSDRKIAKRGKFKTRGCDSPACNSTLTSVVARGVRGGSPVAGADPTTSYLDVIPEARALYKGNLPKRKSITPIDEDGENLLPSQWKRYREQRKINVSDYMDDSGSSGSEESMENDSQITNLQQLPVLSTKSRPRRRRYPSYHDNVQTIDDVMRDFRLTDDTYVAIMKILNEEMEKGLKSETHNLSTVRMFPTYVRSIPDGSENGRFLALDLGGTNFRVLLIDLKGEAEPITDSEIYLIPKRIMLGEGTLLFEHIAKCMDQFLEQRNLKEEKFLMGFTFSFPCKQDGLASARLVRWTKGFNCAGMHNKDVVNMLHTAIKDRKLNVECIAIINDPVGAMISAAHTDKNCMVGLILGTGTNCCFMESLENVGTWDGDMDNPKQVIVNTEWGAFGDDGALSFLRSDIDRLLDKNSLNPGHQLFEKMISGMYMGEIVRLILCQLCAEAILFNGEGSETLLTQNVFLTKYISEIESDDPNGTFPNTKMVLQELDIPMFTSDDCRHVQQVCWQVSQRAAYLASTAVATVINRLNREQVTVSVDGSLYRFHPHFHDLMQKKISQLIKPQHQFKLTLAHDGSGKGAALVAAVAERMKAYNNTLEDNNNNLPEKMLTSQASEEEMTL